MFLSLFAGSPSPEAERLRLQLRSDDEFVRRGAVEELSKTIGGALDSGTPVNPIELRLLARAAYVPTSPARETAIFRYDAEAFFDERARELPVALQKVVVNAVKDGLTVAWNSRRAQLDIKMTPLIQGAIDLAFKLGTGESLSILPFIANEEDLPAAHYRGAARFISRYSSALVAGLADSSARSDFQRRLKQIEKTLPLSNFLEALDAEPVEPPSRRGQVAYASDWEELAAPVLSEDQRNLLNFQRSVTQGRGERARLYQILSRWVEAAGSTVQEGPAAINAAS